MTTPTDSAAATATPGQELARAQEYIQLWRFRARLEYVLIGFVAALAVTIAGGFVIFDLGADDVERWGYPALWVISLLRASSVLLPIPGGGLTIAAGAVMEPVFGIPAPIVVGLVVGSAESLGEFTGYAAGAGGGKMLENRRLYQRLKAWINKQPFLTMLAMSFTPSPLFDVAGLAAGAARVPIRIFYPAILIGKIGRGMAMAVAGYYGFELVGKFL